MSTLLILIALSATVLIGCAAGTPSQSSAEQKPDKASPSRAETPNQKAEGENPSGKAVVKQLGIPTQGSADAPVVLTEYGDYQ